MKIWLDYCVLKYFMEDSDVKFGIGWYRHHPMHKWKGITFHLYLYFWVVTINYVNNYKEYRKRIDFKYSDYLKNKKKEQ